MSDIERFRRRVSSVHDKCAECGHGESVCSDECAWSSAMLSEIERLHAIVADLGPGEFTAGLPLASDEGSFAPAPYTHVDAVRGTVTIIAADEVLRLRLDLAAATAMLAVLCDAPGAADWQAARKLLAELEGDHG